MAGRSVEPEGDDAAPDAAAQLRRMTSLMGRAQQVALEQWAKQGTPNPAVSATLTSAATLMGEAAAAILADPARLATMQADYWRDAMALWAGLAGAGAGAGTGAGAGALAAKADKDKRFRGEAWREGPVFDFVRQAYLLTSDAILNAVGGAQGLDADAKQRALFYTRQFVDAMSPSNFAALNPEVLKAASDTNGEALLAGMEHMLADMHAGTLTMVDGTAFDVGRNIAATPGKVIFENRLFQLIQYAPTTPQVHAVPLLIFPPWINKFYILDLTPEKSFIRWAVAQGLTVFVVSWRNPGSEFAGATIDTYVREGFLEAVDRVLAATGAPATHTIGYCVAGTTLAATLAYLAATDGAERVASATFFTAQVDFEDAGELKVFIDDAQLAAIEELTRETGYLDGKYMAGTFNLLRSNDLIWNYVVNNYMLGKEYIAFDLLYWNADATNVPATWHASYLKDFYRDNRLAKPGGISVEGVPIDLSRVETPAYVQAGKEDHIAPARSVYHIGRHFRGPLRFVLAGSGHIAGVVNPPSSGKYNYWSAEGALPETLDAFVERAVETKGSWWPDWWAWIEPRSGAMVGAREPGPGIEDAPGRYVVEVVGS